MERFWEIIKNYYTKIGISYHVDPLIFLGIHIIATPLFIFSVSWLVLWYHKKKSIFYPVMVSLLIFNAANFYLVVFGRHIPWYIYSILAITTLVTGFFSYLKIRKKMKIIN